MVAAATIIFPPSWTTCYNDNLVRAVERAWARVLPSGCEPSFSPDADFFDLGGHSLLLAKLVSALTDEARLEAPLTIQEVIETPTLGGMARLVENAAVGPIPVTPSLIPETPPEGLSDLASGDGVDPVFLLDSSQGMVKSTPGPSSAALDDRRGPADGVELGGRVETGTTVAAKPVVDLVAESRRLDASIYPAGTRKTGCVHGCVVVIFAVVVMVVFCCCVFFSFRFRRGHQNPPRGFVWPTGGTMIDLIRHSDRSLSQPCSPFPDAQKHLYRRGRLLSGTPGTALRDQPGLLSESCSRELRGSWGPTFWRRC